jgi:hypothetical protein
LIPGTFAACEKKSTFGALAKLNLNPEVDRKFLFAI